MSIERGWNVVQRNTVQPAHCSCAAAGVTPGQVQDRLISMSLYMRAAVGWHCCDTALHKALV